MDGRGTQLIVTARALSGTVHVARWFETDTESVIVVLPALLVTLAVFSWKENGRQWPVCPTTVSFTVRAGSFPTNCGGVA